MKKLLTFLAALMVGVSLAMPAYAKRGEKAEKAHKSEEAEKKETASTTKHGRAHILHARKKGASKGKKEGQEVSNPGQTKEATPKQ